MEENKNINDWKEKFHNLLNICQSELKKTTKIGINMVQASKINSELHQTYEELGQLLVKAHEEKTLIIDDPKMINLISRVHEIHESLNEFEKKVRDIKKD